MKNWNEFIKSITDDLPRVVEIIENNEYLMQDRNIKKWRELKGKIMNKDQVQTALESAQSLDTLIRMARQYEKYMQALSNYINYYQNIIEKQLRELEQLRPKKPLTFQESVDKMAKQLRADKEAKDKRDAIWRAHGICPDCEGAGFQGGQFTGGTWRCDACLETGKS